MTLSRCLLIEIRAKHDQPIDWVGPTQPPGSHPPPTRDAAHGNTLGLKVTAESKKKYMKKSCVVECEELFRSCVRVEVDVLGCPS